MESFVFMGDLVEFHADRLEAGQSTGRTEFDIAAYNGGKMTGVAGFDGPVIINLESIKIPKQRVQILCNHRKNMPVGHTVGITKESNRLAAVGVISCVNATAKTIEQEIRNNFPFQASVSGKFNQNEVRVLKAGESSVVNGLEQTGPASIVEGFELHEISVIKEGDGADTTTVITARKDEPVESVSCINKGESVDKSVDSEGLLRESRRIEAIRSACEGYRTDPQIVDLQAKAIDEGWSYEQFKKDFTVKTLPAHMNLLQDSPAGQQVLEAIALRPLLAQSGLEKAYDERVLEAADKRIGIGLREFCELACGQRLPRFETNESAWLHAAFSTNSNLPSVLSEVGNKSLLRGFEQAKQSWRQFCQIGSFKDYRPYYKYRVTDSLELEDLAPGGKYPHGTLGESSYSIQGKRKGKMIKIPYEYIVNDDIGALSDLPRKFGISTGRTIERGVYSLLMKNLSGTGAFFSADNSNYLAGTDYAFAISGLSKAITKFQQRKFNGAAIDLEPAILLVPVDLVDAAYVLTASEYVNESTSAKVGTVNPHTRRQLKVVSSTLLSDATMTNYSTTGYFLFLDPQVSAAIEVGFRNGMDRPRILSAEADFDSDGMQWKCSIDVAFGMVEPIAAQYQKGVV